MILELSAVAIATILLLPKNKTNIKSITPSTTPPDNFINYSWVEVNLSQMDIFEYWLKKYELTRMIIVESKNVEFSAYVDSPKTLTGYRYKLQTATSEQITDLQDMLRQGTTNPLNKQDERNQLKQTQINKINQMVTQKLITQQEGLEKIQAIEGADWTSW